MFQHLVNILMSFLMRIKAEKSLIHGKEVGRESERERETVREREEEE